MLTVRFFDDVTQDWGEIIQPNTDGGLQIPVVRTDRFDEGLSVADIKIYTNGHDMPVPVPEWTKCRMDYDGEIVDYFVSFCDTEVLARGEKPIYQVELSLIELVKVTQSLMMDSLCFSNDVSDTGVVTTRTIGAVLTRLNNQLFTVPEEDKRDVPFKFFFEPTEAWVGYTAPELFFTEQTLFEALEQIGQVIGGFPYLEYVSSGTYRLKFRMWDNPNTTHWETDEYQQIYEHTGIEGQANVVDSTVKNLLNVSENGENTAVYPAYGDNESDAYRAPTAETFTVDLTDSNVRIQVDSPIYKILKLECYAECTNTVGIPFGRVYEDVTQYLLPFEKWQLLMLGTDLTNNKKPYRNSRMYYTFNKKTIDNIKILELFINKENDGSLQSYGRSCFMRVTYIPMLSARIRRQRMSNEPMKPIMQPVNQPANIVNGGAYSTHLQGLVNRMSGYYRQIVKVIFRDFANPTHTLYKIGDWLNGQIITEAEHTYTNVNIISSYKTSREFNRRSEYVSFPHNIRQWSIPADDKVSDRTITYVENLEFSIGEELPQSKGSLTDLAKEFLLRYTDNIFPPNLAYIAWKHQEQIDADADDQSTNYALASCNSVAVGTSITMMCGAEDNGSMGTRAYDRWTGTRQSNYASELQQFISYDPKSEWLKFRISNKIPNLYNFNDDITETGQEGKKNASFPLTFPMSNKQQFNSSALDSWVACDLKIEKDLRERILFNFQLDFLGKNGTIVYERACIFNKLCNQNPINGFRVWVDGGEYSIWDKKGRGTDYSVAKYEPDFHYAIFILSEDITYKTLAITDLDGNLLFATNKNGNSVNKKITIYAVNRKKRWIKI